jgi:hypothetical protein
MSIEEDHGAVEETSDIPEEHEGETHYYEIACCWGGPPCIVNSCVVDICAGFENESDPLPPKKVHFERKPPTPRPDADAASVSSGADFISRELNQSELIILEKFLNLLYEIRVDSGPLEGHFKTLRYQESTFVKRAELVIQYLLPIGAKFHSFWVSQLKDKEVTDETANMLKSQKKALDMDFKRMKDMLKQTKAGNLTEAMKLMTEVEQNIQKYISDSNCEVIRYDLELVRFDVILSLHCLEKYVEIKRTIQGLIIELQNKFSELEELGSQIGLDEKPIRRLIESLQGLLKNSANAGCVKTFSKDLECLEINCTMETEERREFFLEQKE